LKNLFFNVCYQALPEVPLPELYLNIQSTPRNEPIIKGINAVNEVIFRLFLEESEKFPSWAESKISGR
jgi:hypothetical protein